MSAGGTPAGWYPDVERPGGERYWDGSMWTENRRAGGVTEPTVQGFGGTESTAGYGAPDAPAYASPTNQPSGYQPPGYQPPAGYQPYGTFGRTYAKSSNAGVALALSIAGFVCCGLLSIPGIVMGRKEMNDIDAGLVDPSSRGLAKAAFIVGIVALALSVIGIIAYALLIVAVSGTG
jgi:hypothetical protein